MNSMKKHITNEEIIFTGVNTEASSDIESFKKTNFKKK